MKIIKIISSHDFSGREMKIIAENIFHYLNDKKEILAEISIGGNIYISKRKTLKENKKIHNPGLKRKINLNMIEAAIKSPRTPLHLKKGLMKKYGHLL